MSRQPRVSVCIPTVNRPALLREAIASVAAQTWRDFEIVVADNSGTPEGQRQVDQILAEFPDLQFVVKRHATQVDAIANFNSLIDAAQGELWACLPDDDRFCPTFLSRSVGALDTHPECAFTFADHWLIRADGTQDEAGSASNSAGFSRTSLRERVYEHAELFPLVMKQSICLQAALFRRPVVASLRFLPGLMAGDHSFFIRLSSGKKAFNAYYLPERLAEYRIHDSQITSTTKKKDILHAQIASFESVGDVPEIYAKEFNARLARSYLALALMEAEEGDTARARADAAQSLRLDPRFRTALGALLVTMAPFSVRPLRSLRQLLR